MEHDSLSDTTFEQALASLQEHAPTEVQEEESGLRKIVWLLVSGQHKRTLWIDPSKGFSPVRLEVSDQRVRVGAPKRGDWPVPYVVNEVEWIAVDDIWVPTEFRFEKRMPPPPAGSSQNPTGNLKDAVVQYSYSFNWESINRAIPDELFDVNALGAPKGTIITNVEGEKRFVEGVIGGTWKEPRLQEPTPPVVGLVNSRYVMIVINVVAVLAILSFLVWRRFRTRPV
jgi:hypothetical protein